MIFKTPFKKSDSKSGLHSTVGQHECSLIILYLSLSPLSAPPPCIFDEIPLPDPCVCWRKLDVSSYEGSRLGLSSDSPVVLHNMF